MGSLQAALLVPLLAAAPAFAQGVVTTVAGTNWLFPANGRPAVDAPIGGTFYMGVAADQRGNLFIADADNQMVFRVGPDGIIQVVAGNGIGGHSGDGGRATSASVLDPQSVAVDAAGALYILDTAGAFVRKVTPDGLIHTIAGAGGFGYSGDGGQAIFAEFNDPYSLCVDSAGSVYVADTHNHVIRKITPDGMIHTIAGTGTAGYSGDGGPATSAQLKFPVAVTTDAAGNLYIADSENAAVRMVSPSGTITTVAGRGSLFQDGIPATRAFILPRGLAVDSAGNLYIADFEHRVRKVSNGVITTVAGTGFQGFAGDGGPALKALLNQPSGVTLDSAGNIYIGESGNRRVRVVSPDGNIHTLAGNGQFRFSGEGGLSTSATLYFPGPLAVDYAHNLYIAEPDQSRVRKVAPNGIITTVAGNGQQGYNGDGRPATSASLWFPSGLAAGSFGELYIADYNNSRVRRVTQDGIISTFAGNGNFLSAGDGLPAKQASVDAPTGLALDGNGNLYIAEYAGNRVRKVTPDGIIHAYAGSGQAGYFGDGLPATLASLNAPSGLALDGQGNLYIADSLNNVIRKVTSQGAISTVAGNGKAGYSGDGGQARSASLSVPSAVVVDSAGNLYIADEENFVVREVTTDGVIHTIAGNAGPGFGGDGGPATLASFGGPDGLVFDAAGDLLISDFLNSRVRAILTTPPGFQSSPASLTFSGVSAGVPPPSQNVQLSSTIPGVAFGGMVTPLTTPSWLQVTPNAGFMPASAQVQADPTHLAPGTYQAAVNFQAPYAVPNIHTLPVTFTVSPAPPAKLAEKPDAFSFSLVQGGVLTAQTITISNQGGGSLTFTATASVNAGGSWLSVSPGRGTATPTKSAALLVTVSPSGLAAGTYSGSIIVVGSTGESIVVPVVMTLSPAPQTIRLLKGGLTFTAIAGGGVTPAQSFGVRNGGRNVMTWSASATVLSGSASWLSVAPASGSSNAASTEAPAVQVSADPTGLAAGVYYGQVAVAAPQADNSPQVVSVVLSVLPPGSNPGPIAQPAGLVFTGAAGGESPGSQTVMLTNLSAGPLTYTSALSTLDGGNWFVYLPATATVPAQQSQTLVVQPNLDGLSPGVYQGSLTLLYSGGGSTAISILLVVQPSSAQSPKDLRLAAGCTPTQLVPVITSLSNSFSVAASWPNPIEAQVVDDCGNALVNGSVIASFSNGDPPRVLTHANAAVWSGTWQPRGGVAAPVTLTVDAQSNQLSLKGSAQITGGLRATLSVPLITSGAVVSSASLVPRTPVAPGGLISILGSDLADSTVSAGAPPYGATLGGVNVLIGGVPAPLIGVSGGRIDAIVPSSVPGNSQQQVIVFKGDVNTVPEPVAVASAQPAIFSQDKSGAGQASVFAVGPEGSQSLADASHPVTAGDSIIILCAGLGAVNPAVADGAQTPDSPPSATANPVTVSIGGVDAPVSFAGLAPGAIGVYQVNATVPSGVGPDGAVPIVLTVAGQVSPAVTIAVQ